MNFSNTGKGEALTRASFERALQEMVRARKEHVEPISSPRERQIISHFFGANIFPPQMYEVMVRRGMREPNAPAWTDEEFKVLCDELREALEGREE